MKYHLARSRNRTVLLARRAPRHARTCGCQPVHVQRLRQVVYLHEPPARPDLRWHVLLALLGLALLALTALLVMPVLFGLFALLRTMGGSS